MFLTLPDTSMTQKSACEALRVFFVRRVKGESSSPIMGKWTKEMEEQLIALVEERPPLYNITLQGYSKRKRKELWHEIESKLHLSGNISYFCTTCNKSMSTTMHEKQDLKIVEIRNDYHGLPCNQCSVHRI